MLSQLQILQFRNLHKVLLSPATRVNLILGENGAGKTSLLEAIHLLGLGRSFRTRQLKNIVEYDNTQCQVIGKIAGRIPVGFQYDLHHGVQIRLNNAPLKKLSELASHLPLQFIPANCHEFFEMGPRFRRKLVDWGLFHVEQEFLFHWQSYKKCLQQRNAGIRQHKSDPEIKLWDPHLVRHGQQLNNLRQLYLQQLLAVFKPIFRRICPELAETNFTLRYLSGWPKDHSFADVLDQTLERDRALAYTRSGAHAADWSLRMDGADPAEMLSRGQQKLFYLALSLAQIELLMQRRQTETLLLIDDLSSELDEQHQQIVLTLLAEMPVQSFISSTNMALSEHLFEQEQHAVFHVKQGKLESITAPVAESRYIVE